LNRAHDYLRAAEHEFNGQFYARSVSTAYYAMFYAATAVLLSLNVERAKRSDVIVAFGEQFIRTRKLMPELGRMLNQALEAAEASDYDEIPNMDAPFAKQRITDARSFIDAIVLYLELLDS